MLISQLWDSDVLCSRYDNLISYHSKINQFAHRTQLTVRYRWKRTMWVHQQWTSKMIIKKREVYCSDLNANFEIHFEARFILRKNHLEIYSSAFKMHSKNLWRYCTRYQNNMWQENDNYLCGFSYWINGMFDHAKLQCCCCCCCTSINLSSLELRLVVTKAMQFPLHLHKIKSTVCCLFLFMLVCLGVYRTL